MRTGGVEGKSGRFKSVRPKPVALGGEELVRIGSAHTQQELPLLVEPLFEGVDLLAWARAHSETIDALLLKHGAIMFRGFALDLHQEFESFAQVVCRELFNENGEHPRNLVSGNVYTPVFYPGDRQLLWHNENSFNHSWPQKILFACVKPAEQGGETPVVDSRRVCERIRPEIRKEFVEKKVMYVRNYGGGLGLDWQTVFGTTDRAEVEARCRRNLMEFEWRGDHLRTSCVRPAIVRHPRTGEEVWFNQAQHWHISCLDSATRQTITSLFREEDWPRSCYYGDGSRIEDAVMMEILDVYRELEASLAWRAGDILMLDNLLAAHGRNAFVGERRLLVAMGEMSDYGALESRPSEA